MERYSHLLLPRYQFGAVRYAGLYVCFNFQALYTLLLLTIPSPEWPQDSEMRTNSSFRTQLRGLISVQDGAAKSLLFDFKETQVSNLIKALQAPVCEFVSHLTPIELFLFCFLEFPSYWNFLSRLLSISPPKPQNQRQTSSIPCIRRIQTAIRCKGLRVATGLMLWTPMTRVVF